METDIFTLCDSAKDYNGKLVIMGAQTKFSVTTIPKLHQELTLVARIKCKKGEKIEKNLSVLFSIKKENEDVYMAKPRTMQVNLGDIKEELDTINIILKINNMIIPTTGNYIMSLVVDEQVFKTGLKIVQEVK